MTGKTWNLKGGPGRVVSAAILVVVLAAAGAAAKGPSTSDTPRSGAVSIRVVMPDGSPAAGTVITMGRTTFVADAEGKVSAVSIPVGSGVVSGEIWRKEGGVFGLFRNDVRYVGFLPIDPKEGGTLSATLPLSPVAGMDSSCRKCHPEKGGRGAMIKCAHRSGVPVKPAQAARVYQFNKDNDGLRKSGKAGYPAIVLESRKVGSGFFGGQKRPFLVCTSCHSNHVETGQRAYVLMPFDEVSVLCRGCHV